MCYCMPTQDPVKRITIIPSSKGALGYVLHHPQEDKYSAYKQELKESIAVAMGGRVAEELLYGGDFTAGATADIQNATSIARNMVTRYGMSDLGPILYGSEHGYDEVFLGRDFSSNKTYSEETAAKIDIEIKKIVDEAYEQAKKAITEHREKWEFVAEYLIKYEEMDSEQFKRAMDEDVSAEEIYAMAEERRERSRRENEEKARIDEDYERRKK